MCCSINNFSHKLTNLMQIKTDKILKDKSKSWMIQISSEVMASSAWAHTKNAKLVDAGQFRGDGELRMGPH